MNKFKIISLIFVLVGIGFTLVGLFYCQKTLDKMLIENLLFFHSFRLPIFPFRNLNEYLEIYLLLSGYIFLFCTFSTLLYGLKIKISNNWRYFSFLLGQIYGFTLFFLRITIYEPPRTSNFILDVLPISVIIIIAGSLSLVWGLKKEWDELWKLMSINTSIVMNIVVLLLGFVLFENAYSRLYPISEHSTPGINIGIFLIISAILLNLGISGLLAINFGLKLRNFNIILLFISIIGAHIFLLLGSSTYVLEFVSVNISNLLKSPKSLIYMLTCLIFAGTYVFLLILIKKEIFQIAYRIKHLEEQDSLTKLIDISQDELLSLKNIDIYTVGDLASEVDPEEISKITKINLDRINTLINSAKESLLKNKKNINSEKI